MDSAALIERVGRLIDKRQGIAFIVPEDTGYFSIDHELVERVRALIAETTELLRRICDDYNAESLAHGREEEPAAAEGDFLKEIGAQISSELAARELSDLAFVSRGQLQEIEAALKSALEHQQIWAVASHADSGLRAAGKALIAVESAMYEFEGQPPPDRRWVDLRDSLAIRRLYGRFRHAILYQDVAETTSLEGRLRRAVHRIGLLRDVNIYPFLRIHDRKQVRRLQKRITAWLEAKEGRDVADGRRLLGDLEGFARLLAKVNDREELREHDRQAVRTVHRMLFRSSKTSRAVSAAQREELERLFGLDDELDAILLAPGEQQVADLKAPLERIEMELELPAVRVPEGFHVPQ